ncbi:MAG: response regulator transcription factor [Desulfobacterales bacterium]|nr:response regulator transcription factor [Desulfobacterales bacterium]
MMKTNNKRILVIEDEVHIAEGIKLNLTLQGYAVKIAADGVAGIAFWKEWQPDLIVLDIMLPGIDGLAVLQNIRLEDERLPVLILSAKATDRDRIKGFSLGVDDYLAKPFNLEEFLLRVDRLLTRVAWENESRKTETTQSHSFTPTYTFGSNRIEFETATARCQAGKITLTEQELKLLKLFIIHRGKPLARKKILEIGWGYTGGMTTRTVDNFIVRFRKYFEDNPKKPAHFKSVRSVGYRFDP